MTANKAKEVLLLYRGNADEALDPEINAALQLAEKDPELGLWLENHLAFQTEARNKLRRIKVPDQLKKDLLNRKKILPHRASVAWWVQPGIAAAALLIIGLGSLVTLFLAKQSDTPDRFSHYQSRMIGTALRQYRMDILTNDMRQVREFMARKGSPADYQIPTGLEGLQLTGGGALKWRNNPVSMVCFDRGDNQMLYLFIMKQEALNDPPPRVPRTSRISDLAAASWSEGGNTYLLAGPAEPGFPKKYIQ